MLAEAMASLTLTALSLAQTGKRGEAVALLRKARDAGPLDESATSLLYTLLGEGSGDEAVDVEDDDRAERLALCEHALGLSPRPLGRSTWHLRRALLLLDAGLGREAVLDLQAVLKLKAAADHEEAARSALLKAASLTARQGRPN